MYHRALLAACLVCTGGLSACDSDHDGLKNREEKELGFDPKNDDMDGDGLLDGDDPFPTQADSDADRLDDLGEREAGSDPANPDTDGDGYLDGDEVYEGKDPTDPKSKIYKGGWPYYFFKDELGNKKFDGSPVQVGDKFPRFKAIDQKGEIVDLYDFGGPDQDYDLIVIDASAEWCGPCRAGADWLVGGPDVYGLEADYAEVRAAVDDGTLLWVSVITQDYNYAPGDAEAVKRWDDDFHHKKIPVLADEDSYVEDYVIGATGGWPSGVVLKAKTMKVQHVDFMIPGLLDYVKNEL